MATVSLCRTPAGTNYGEPRAHANILLNYLGELRAADLRSEEQDTRGNGAGPRTGTTEG